MSSLASCNSNNSRTDFSSNYALLSNCSAKIKEKCTPLSPDQTIMTGMTKCNGEMTKIRSITDGKNGKRFEYLIDQ